MFAVKLQGFTFVTILIRNFLSNHNHQGPDFQNHNDSGPDIQNYNDQGPDIQNHNVVGPDIQGFAVTHKTHFFLG